MQPIDFEDRTNETQEQIDQRQAFGAGLMLAQMAYQVANGDTRLALQALSAAVGIGIARTDVSIDEVLDLVKHFAATARAQIAATRTHPKDPRDPGN